MRRRTNTRLCLVNGRVSYAFLLFPNNVKEYSSALFCFTHVYKKRVTCAGFCSVPMTL